MLDFFSTIASKIITGIVAVGLMIGSLFGINTPVENPAQSEIQLGATVPTVVALFSTTLASAITSTATSFTLTSGTTEDSTTLSGTYGFVIDEGTSSEEFVLATCVDTVCTGATRGVSAITGNTTITALRSSHSRGASVKISDHPQLAIISRIVNGDESFPNNMTITGTVSSGSTLAFGGKATYQNTETISDDKDLTSKAYVDGVIASGAPDASITVKGLVEEATQAEIDAKTAAGGTSARLFINPSTLRATNINDYVASDTGAADAYAIATDPVITAYAEGQVFIFEATNANTTASTLAVCGLAATAIKKNHDVALVAGDIEAGQTVVVAYDGTNMQMVSPIGTSPASIYQLLSNIDTTVTLGGSDTKYPSQNAVKTYVDTNLPLVTWKSGVAIRDTGTATGDQIIAHGLGRTPRYIKITCQVAGTTTQLVSMGSYNGSAYAVQGYDGSTTITQSTSYLVFAGLSGGNPLYTATVTLDGTNITLHWVRTGSTGVLNFLWEVF